jgi:outer membrane protein assembly factor BamA
MKKEIFDNNTILLKAMKEERTTDEWFNRMESNLSVIFGEIREEKKKDKASKKVFADKLFEQVALLHNGQEVLASLLQKESIETRRMFGNDLLWTR